MKKIFKIQSLSRVGLIKMAIGIFILLFFCLSPLLAAPCGDVNSSGGVDIIDALMTAQYYVGLNPAGFDTSAADVSGDGSINIVDALQIAQFYVGLITSFTGCQSPTPPPLCPTETYELQAETEATWDDAVIESEHAGYTGNGYVNAANSAGRWIEWTINVSAASSAICEFTYACASEARPMDLSLNGSAGESLSFPASGAWTTWTTQTASVILEAGANTIRLTATAASGAANIDKMDITINDGCIVTPGPTTPPPTPTPIPSGWTPPPVPAVKHWHESGGFGISNITGGVGGTVIKVTNLNKSGSGSFAAAVGASGKRLVVFEVGGVINMSGSGITIKNGNLTIAGQTAPYPGITIIRCNFRIQAENVVISHISVRLGDGVSAESDTMETTCNNVVIDHVASSWAIDECFTSRPGVNITMFKSIVSEGLQYAGHEDVEHSKGVLIYDGVKDITLIGSLYAHNALRNPRIGDGRAVVTNTVVYDWAPGWDHIGPHPDPNNPVITDDFFNYVVSIHDTDLSYVGNVALQGPESVGMVLVSTHIDRTGGRVYMEDNIIKDREGNDGIMTDGRLEVLDSPPLWPTGLETIPAHESLYEVLRTAGPRPGDRDPINTRIVREVASGTGRLIDSQNDVGGYPDYPETRRSITVPQGAAAQQEWLDALEDEIAVDRDIDLSRLYSIVGSQASDRLAP